MTYDEEWRAALRYVYGHHQSRDQRWGLDMLHTMGDCLRAAQALYYDDPAHELVPFDVAVQDFFASALEPANPWQQALARLWSLIAAFNLTGEVP